MCPGDEFNLGRKFLGVRYPIMCGAMTWVSDHSLVSAVSNAGGFGVLANGSMGPEELGLELRKTQSMTDMHFGVNLITIHPAFNDLVDACLDNKVRYIVVSGGLVNSSLISRLHSEDVKVLGFASSLSVAKRLVRNGIDGLIIEGSEAGGHVGPVSTGVLAQEILPHFRDSDIPVFVAGGIGTGQALAGYMLMGAAGCQMGTRFVCAHESRAHRNYKNIFLTSSARDARVSVQLSSDFPVMPVRSIVNSGWHDFVKLQRKVIKAYEDGELTKEEGVIEIEKFWVGALKKAVVDGDVVHGSVMAGQSVGLVDKEQSVMELIDELWCSALNFLDYISGSASRVKIV